MSLRLEKYRGRTYVSYVFEDKLFDNAHYFCIDTKSAEFIEIMEHTGGYVASMTTRHFKEKGINVKFLYICSLPQKTFEYKMGYFYLSEDGTILDYMIGDNYNDYEYFEQKFESCTCERGWSFDLDWLAEFVSDSSLSLGVLIDGQEVNPDITYVSNDLSVFKGGYRNNLGTLGASLELKMTFTHLGGVVIDGKALKDGVYLTEDQVGFCSLDRATCLVKLQKMNPKYLDEDLDWNDFKFSLTLEQFKAIANKVHIKV